MNSRRIAHRGMLLTLLIFLASTTFAEPNGLPTAGNQTESSGGASRPVQTDNLRATLVSEYHTISPGETFWVALRQEIRPHWHTYWKNPGDSGEPTELSWDLPEGWQVSDIHWPPPERIPVGPLVNFGYSDEVFLLAQIRAPPTLEVGTKIDLNLSAYWLVCEEECIPEDGDFSLSLNTANTSSPSDWYDRLHQAEMQLPKTYPWAATFQHSSDTLTLSLELPAQGNLVQATFFPEHKDLIVNAATQAFSYEGEQLTVTIPASFGLAALDNTAKIPGLIVLKEKLPGGNILTSSFHIAAEANATAPSNLAPQTSTAPQHIPAMPFWVVAIMALAGGAILNLMPCVFPVLSIKVLSLATLGRQHTTSLRATAIRHGLLYSGGVVLGIALLGVILIALKSAGIATGWGFHLQNSALILVLALLFFVIGLSFSGAIEIGSRWMGVGSQLTEHGGAKGSFFTGLLAAVAASPCSAPFMGIALGYALIQPTPIALSVFVLLGIGMALPFFLLCLFPLWLNYLPKPGVWMQKLREVLAFPMYATAIWLTWVLAQQIGANAVLLTTGSALAIAWLLWSHKNTQRGWRIAAMTIGILPLALAIIWIPKPSTAQDQTTLTTSSNQNQWHTFTPEALNNARATGAVLVNFTADWCITCKANELVALSTDTVEDLYRQKNITLLKADWTRRDSDIAKIIAGFGRSGVPLYLWYSPGAQEPEILPQLLTENFMIERLQTLPDSSASLAPTGETYAHIQSSISYQPH